MPCFPFMDKMRFYRVVRQPVSVSGTEMIHPAKTEHI